MLTALLFFALAQRQRVATPAPSPIDWKIEIATDGGISGGGVGGLTIASDGTLSMVMINGKRCSYHLSSSELQMIDTAVRNARPATWLECYSLADVSTHCCDLIRTTMTLSERGGRDVFTTSWLTGGALPSDLQSIVDVLKGPAGLDTRYRALCASTP